MKRYTMDDYIEDLCDGPVSMAEMVEDADGEWVRHDDAQAENEALTEALAAMQLAVRMATSSINFALDQLSITPVDAERTAGTLRQSKARLMYALDLLPNASADSGLLGHQSLTRGGNIMNNQEAQTRIRNAFIFGMATTTNDFNGECAGIAFAPRNPYNRDSPEEVDLFEFFANPAVNDLADKYMGTVAAGDDHATLLCHIVGLLEHFDYKSLNDRGPIEALSRHVAALSVGWEHPPNT